MIWIRVGRPHPPSEKIQSRAAFIPLWLPLSFQLNLCLQLMAHTDAEIQDTVNVREEEEGHGRLTWD